jgi:hypothetical protein
MANRELNVVLGIKLTEFEKGLNTVEKKLTQLSKKTTQLGKTLTTNLTLPIAAFGAGAVLAFQQQEDAERKLSAALQATGKDVDSNMQRFKSFASELQKLTIVGDESSLALLQVATSQGLNADQAERATKNAIALSAAFGVNQDAAIKMTGALEQGNVSMLKRTIPALKGIKDDAEAAAKAQEILNDAFKIAEAEAQTSRGQIIQLKNAFGDFMEEIGGVIASGLTPFIAKLKSVTEFLQNLSPEFKKNIVVVGLAVAAIGPLVFIFGKIMALGPILISVIKGIGSALIFMTSPIGLTIAAIAAIVAAIVILYNKFEGVRKVVNGVIDVFVEFIKIMSEGAQAFFRGFKNLSEGNFKAAAKDFAEAMVKTNPITAAITQGKRLGAAFVEGYADESNRLAGVFDKLKASISGGGAAPSVGGGFSGGVGGDETTTTSGGGGGARRSFSATPLLSKATTTVIQQNGRALNDVNLILEQQGTTLERVNAVYEARLAYEEKELQNQAKSMVLMQGLNGIADVLTDTMAAVFDKSTSAIKTLLGGLKQLVIQLVKTIAKAAILAALMSLIPGGSAVGGILGQMGVASGKGSFIANLTKGITGFANGGLITGPTLGLIGEGRGTSMSNPEVVAPLDKLKSMLDGVMGGGDFVASTRLAGSDLLLVVERAQRNRGR